MTETINPTKKRSAAIDMIKGLSILTLFFLHFEQGWMHPHYNFFIVRSPAFYLVIGWLWGMSSNKRTIKEHWEKRKKGLVIPYLWFSLIFIVLDIILLAIGYIDSFILYRDLYKTICLRGIGTLWFLPALLTGEMLFIYCRDRKLFLKVLLYSIAILYITLYNHYDPIIHIGNIGKAIEAPLLYLKDSFNAYIYISIAYYISIKYGKIIFNGSRIRLIISGLFGCVIAFIMFNFMKPIFGLGTLHFIIYNCIAGFGMLFLFRGIEEIKPIAKPLTYFGKNSLIVMTMHWFLFMIVLQIDANILGFEQYYGNRTILYFIIAVLVLIGIIELINRKFKFIIGK